MLIKILAGLAGVMAAAAAIILLLASKQPDDFRMSRSISINASPAKVHGFINDFHKWEAWSPWAKLDPTQKTDYAGPAAGVGASYHWAGDGKVGEGRMTITKSVPGELVALDLQFIKPFEASNPTEFTLKPEGKGCSLTWTMTGKNNLMFKVVGLFMDMEKSLGPQFDQGLNAIKGLAEAAK
jgi:hypothetical protein